MIYKVLKKVLAVHARGGENGCFFCFKRLSKQIIGDTFKYYL